jgi:hypothetical protein
MPPAPRGTRRTDAPASPNGRAAGPSEGADDIGADPAADGRAGPGADGKAVPWTDVVDRGSFTFGTCRGCGWTGPGRRARATAAQDAVRHAEAGCAGGPVAAAAHALPAR